MGIVVKCTRRDQCRGAVAASNNNGGGVGVERKARGQAAAAINMKGARCQGKQPGGGAQDKIAQGRGNLLRGAAAEGGNVVVGLLLSNRGAIVYNTTYKYRVVTSSHPNGFFMKYVESTEAMHGGARGERQMPLPSPVRTGAHAVD